MSGPIKPIGLSCLIALLLGFPSPLDSQDELMGWSTRNRSNGLAMIRASVVDAVTVFTLENDTSKIITAFVVSHDGIRHSIDFFQSSAELRPAASYDLRLSSAELLGTDHVLDILVVVFADGSAKGSQAEALFIGAKRLGRVLETERVRKILDSMETLDSADAALAKLRKDLGTLPSTADQALGSMTGVDIPGLTVDALRTSDKRVLEGVLFGIRTAREDALWKVAGLERLPVSGNGMQSPRSQALLNLRGLYTSLGAKNAELLRGKEQGK